jgi:hypothetical protein
MSVLHITYSRTAVFLTKASQCLKYHMPPFYYCNARKTGKKRRVRHSFWRGTDLRLGEPSVKRRDYV